MKLTTMLLSLTAAVASAQVSTQIAVFNPVTGIRFYPSIEIAETAVPIEARYLCLLPTSVPQCSALAEVMHFGVLVTTVKNEPAVRAVEVSLRYSEYDGSAKERIEYMRGNSPSKIFWIGRVRLTEVSVTPLVVMTSR